MEEWVFNVVNPILVSLYGIFGDVRRRRFQRKVLRKLLTDGRYEWRTLKSLSRSIREQETTTKELLTELGARASTSAKDVWTLTD
jgi:hypothetical protein